MLDLSPTKLFVIVIIAVVIVGPRRLPGVAHELAKLWRRVREIHAELDREVRQSIPDLPAGVDLVRYARSPVALLNQLIETPLTQEHASSGNVVTPEALYADGSDGSNGPPAGSVATLNARSGEFPPASGRSAESDRSAPRISTGGDRASLAAADDPCMN